jgi:DNA polymerase III alpha subunit
MLLSLITGCRKCRLTKDGLFGFKTLTLIKDTVKLVKYRTGIQLDPDAFPIDDVKHMSYSSVVKQ